MNLLNMINNVLKMLLLSHVDVLGHRLIYEGTLYSTTSGKQWEVLSAPV